MTENRSTIAPCKGARSDAFTNKASKFRDNLDLKRSLRVKRRGVRQRLETDLVQSIGRVGDKLTKEDFLPDRDATYMNGIFVKMCVK